MKEILKNILLGLLSVSIFAFAYIKLFKISVFAVVVILIIILLCVLCMGVCEESMKQLKNTRLSAKIPGSQIKTDCLFYYSL